MNASSLEVLFRAAVRGNEKEVTKLLAQDPPLFDPTNAKTALNSRAVVYLDSAASQGPRNLMIQILTKWPDLISIEDAARYGADEVLNVMFSRDPQSASVLSKNDHSRTALHAAVMRGHESTVALLLAKDPELIHVVDLRKRTPLHCTMCTPKVSIAKQLLDHTPELINAVDSLGFTALHSAVLYNTSIEMINFLLERSPGLSDAVDVDHRNALHWAARRGHKEAFFKLLAQNPRTIDGVTSENKNILHLAAQADNLQVLDAILELRPEFACGVDIDGNTALHCVLGRGRDPYVEESHWARIWQLNPGALRAVNKYLQTPSMVAIGRGFLGEKELSLTQKLSWDDLIADHEVLKLKRRDLSEKLNMQLQISRNYAEEQCESGLSSALFIPGVIDIVKSYSFSVEVEEPEPSLKQKIEEIEDGEYWHWGNYDL